MTKRFDAEDQIYFSFRKKLSETEFNVDDLDHFTLYTGIHNFARKKFVIDQFEETLDITGNIYEFGTWKGATLILLASWYRLMRPQGHKTIYVFDTFEGLGEGTPDDGHAFKMHQGSYKSDFQFLKDVVESKGLDYYINFVTGDACTTVVNHFKNIPLKKVSFALLDMDLYQPTKFAIDEILPNLTPGGKIILDEGTCEEWQGEQKALNYLIDEADRRKMKFTVRENSYTRQPTSVFTRIA